MFLYHIKADKTIVRFYMEPLSDKTEKLIDNLSKKGIDGYFVNSEEENIFLRDIVLYGDIDINNEEDKDLIRKSNILNEDNGFYAHSDFNYEDACIYTKDGIVREYQSWDKIVAIRNIVSNEYVCMGMPQEMETYMNYINNLKYDERPDYEYLIQLFLNILKKIGGSNEQLFSWADKKKNSIVKKIIIQK